MNATRRIASRGYRRWLPGVRRLEIRPLGLVEVQRGDGHAASLGDLADGQLSRCDCLILGHGLDLNVT